MRNLEKSEFKKLTWKDNATEFGKERGLAYVVGELQNYCLIEAESRYLLL